MTAKGLAFVSLPRVGALRAGWVACCRPRANCLTNVTATVDPLAAFSLSCPPGLSAARGVAVAVEGGVVVAMGGCGGGGRAASHRSVCQALARAASSGLVPPGARSLHEASQAGEAQRRESRGNGKRRREDGVGSARAFVCE